MNNKTAARICLALGILALAIFSSSLAFATEYSAEQVQYDGVRMRVVVYSKGTNIRRLEQTAMRKTVIVILRCDKHVCWILDPRLKTYKELPSKPATFSSGWKNRAKASPKTTTFLGTEMVNGYLCDKYRETDPESKKHYIIWVSKKLEIIFKVMTDESPKQTTIEVKNVKEHKLNNDLFEIPKGYRKDKAPMWSKNDLK